MKVNRESIAAALEALAQQVREGSALVDVFDFKRHANTVSTDQQIDTQHCALTLEWDTVAQTDAKVRP